MPGPVGQLTNPRYHGLRLLRAPSCRLVRTLGACLATIELAGCADIQAHDARLRTVVEDRWERAEARIASGLSREASSVLDCQQLLTEAERHPDSAARLLGARLETQTVPDGALALAELSYRVGLLSEPGSPAVTMAWYRDAATLAALALADPEGSRPDVAVEIHNRALARLIRLAEAKVAQRQVVKPNWREVLGRHGLAVISATAYLQPERIADLRVASEYRVEGMGHVYQTSGLGVPLVAHCWAERDSSSEADEQFFPREMRVAATAIVAPGGGLLGGEWKRHPATLELCDPFQRRSVAIGDKSVVLASDRTTPLASQVARRNSPRLSGPDCSTLTSSGWASIPVFTCSAPMSLARFQLSSCTVSFRAPGLGCR